MNKFDIYAFSDEAGDSLSEQIKAVSKNNYKGIEIRGVDGESIVNFTKQKAKEIKKQLDDNGLIVWSIGSPIGKIKIDDDFNKHLDEFMYTLELANILGAKHFRLFSFFVDEITQAVSDEVMRRLGVFCEKSKGSGILLCHENEKEIFGDIADRCVLIHQNFPEIKAIFDPANFIQSGQETMDAWKKLKRYVEYLHIKDALEDGTVVPVGHGVGNLEYIIKDYMNNGGHNMTLEPHLFDFIGFDKLETEKKEKKFAYNSSMEAFDAAAGALNAIIDRI